MKSLGKIALSLSLFALCSCAGSSQQKKGSSDAESGGDIPSPSSTNSSSNSGASSLTENVDDVFSAEERIDLLGDFASQEAEDLSSITNVIDVSSIEDGGILNVSEAGTYLVQGKNENAKILVSASGEVKLILNGVDLTSEGDASLEVSGPSSFTLHVASKTKNYLSDGVSNANDGALVCKKTPLNIEGSGYLFLTSSKKTDDSLGAGIKSPKGMNVQDAHLIVTATGHAINSKGGANIEGAKLSLTAGKDGIHAEEGAVLVKDSTLDCSTKGDGIDSVASVTLENVTSHFESEGTYLLYDASADTDGTLKEDSRYILQNGEYKKIDSDSMDRYSTRYYLDQHCKGVKSEAQVKFVGGDHYFKTADDCIASDTEIDLLSGDYSLYTADQGINSDKILKIGETGGTSSLDLRVYHCFEGIQGGEIHFYSGYTYVLAEDDGINAASDALDASAISMNFHDGATVYVNAEGDGVDSNGSISMDGGNLIVCGPSSGGNGSLDFDKTFTFTGGNLLAVGSNSMAQVPNTGSVNAVSYSGSGWNKGVVYALHSGNQEFALVLPKALSSVSFIVQSPSLATSSSLSITKGESLDVPMRNGVYFGSEAGSGGTSLATGTVQSGLTTFGRSDNHPGGGRGPGGR